MCGIFVARVVWTVHAIGGELPIMARAGEARIQGLIGVAINRAPEMRTHRRKYLKAFFFNPSANAMDPNTTDHVIGIKGPRILTDVANHPLHGHVRHFAELYARDRPKITGRARPIAWIDEISNNGRAKDHREDYADTVSLAIDKLCGRRFRMVVMHEGDTP